MVHHTEERAGEHYRRRAAEMLDLAKGASQEEAKMAYERLASMWASLARQVDQAIGDRIPGEFDKAYPGVTARGHR